MSVRNYQFRKKIGIEEDRYGTNARKVRSVNQSFCLTQWKKTINYARKKDFSKFIPIISLKLYNPFIYSTKHINKFVHFSLTYQTRKYPHRIDNQKYSSEDHIPIITKLNSKIPYDL